jgi:hypothetical protein
LGLAFTLSVFSSEGEVRTIMCSLCVALEKIGRECSIKVKIGAKTYHGANKVPEVLLG